MSRLNKHRAKAGKTKPGSLLIDVLPFTAEELAANRDGYMTQSQREAIRKEMYPHPLVAAVGIFLIGIVGYAAICALLIWEGVSGTELFLWFGGTIGITGGIVMLGAMVQTTLQRRATRKDLYKGIVQAACGPAQLTISPGRTHTYKLSIDGTSFWVPPQVLLAFHNGQPYCIYYAPHLKKILSAEELF